MNGIIGQNIIFRYRNRRPVLDGVDFTINFGEMTAILGKNGCGKSTLAKLLAALMPVTSGHILINGLDINSGKGVRFIRQHLGIVFQNPDNQFVSPIIEDDIRFGLNNHLIPRNEQTERIRSALNRVNLSGFEKRNINTLSGGQKQRAAIAGVLAMDCDIFIFDECTSMLDPQGRQDLIRCIRSLQNENKTIILITQNTEEAIFADRICLMADQSIYACGTPRDILTDFEKLVYAGVEVPFPVRVFHDLQKESIFLPYCPLTDEELAEAICSLK